MAGNIQGLRVKMLRRDIGRYCELVRKMAQNFSSIYTYMKELRTYWTGKRINQVINVWNSNCDDVNTNVLYFCDEMLRILHRVYFNYCNLEHQPPEGVPTYGGSKTITEKIELTDETNITFDKIKVETTSNNINEEITKANSYLKDLIKVLDVVRSYSDSLRGLVEKYRSKANSVQSSLTKLCNIVQTELENAIHDVNITEQYNESDANQAGSVPQGGSSGSGTAGENPGSGSAGENPGSGSAGESSGSGSAGGSSGSGSHVESSGSQGTGSGRGSSGGRSPSGRGSGSNSSGGGTGSEQTPEPTPEPTPDSEAEPKKSPFYRNLDPSVYKPGDPWWDWDHKVERSYPKWPRTLE